MTKTGTTIHTLHLIGIAPDGSLSERGRRALGGCVLAAVSGRTEPVAEALRVPTVPLVPMAGAFRSLGDALGRGDAAVLAGGDPLLYGIGRKVLAAFGNSAVKIHPAVSSMQTAFARIALPWDDARILSLHVRPLRGVAALVSRHGKVGLFTDPENSPSRIAAHLLTHGIRRQAWVFEQLGTPAERITEGALEEIASRDFDPLNVMILIDPDGTTPQPAFGLGENAIVHSRGLITKDEIRAVALHRLRLPPRGVLWDVGAGSGSVAVEAARLAPGLQVFAVERRPDEVRNIRRNREVFAADGITVVEGEAPGVLGDLPDPDRVFLGGSGGKLPAILEAADSRLRPGGRIVATAVLETSKEDIPRILRQRGFTVTASDVGVTRLTWPGGNEIRTDLNTIRIITAER